MNKAGWRLVLLLAVVGSVFVAPAIATAAAPPSMPIAIKTATFNSGLDGFTLSGIQLSSEPYTSAYWGRTTGTTVNERRGTTGNGLWCASKYYPTGTARAYGTYPVYTRGKAELDLVELQDYYSASLNFYYIMSAAAPFAARGAADANSLSVYWDDVAGNKRQADYTFDTTLASWVSRAEDLSDPDNQAVLSRKAGRLTFQWFDFIEQAGSSPLVGRGPTLDDITISGFKYGPVRNLSATAGASSIDLSWGTPDRATDSPIADDRLITYRVWRVVHGRTDWIELTTSNNRVAGLVYTDSTAQPGTLYDYAVQAWEPGIGTKYGTYVTTTGSLVDNAAPTVSSNAVASYNNAASITITGADTGSGVKEIRYTLNGGSVQVVSGTSATVAVNTLGSNSLQYWAVDYANNESSKQTKNFMILDTLAPSVTSNAGVTYNNQATITMTGTDSGSGVREIRYTLDAGGTTVTSGATAQAVVSAPGSHTLIYWAIDNSGNESAHISKTFSVQDTVDPVAAAVVAATYNNSASITVTASDSGSGVREIRYKVDGGTDQVVAGASATVSITTTGQHTLTYWAVDNSGNDGSPQIASFTVLDTIIPTVSSDAGTTYDDVASIVITGQDSGSGVKEIRYKVDGGVEQIAAGASKTVVISTAGSHSLQYRAIDNSGNSSGTQTKNFTIADTQPPTVWSNAGATYNNAASITIGAEDPGSGIKEIRYILDGGSTQIVSGSTATVNLSAAGSHTLEYWAVDNANLNSVHQDRDFVITTGAVITQRLADRSRLDTAVKIGRTAFDPAGDKSWTGVTDIIIASGDDRGAADPLAAAGLVWRYNAPLFLVSANAAIPASLKQAISEIADANGAIKVHMVGGPVAVPDARYTEIKAAALAGGGSVVDATASATRVMGTSGGRYGTAARIAELMSQKANPPVVFIANGADYAKFSDALALSAISAQKGYPILLVQQGSAPQATLDAIAARHKGDRIIVAGGVNTVSDTAARQAATAATYTWNATNDRWAGQNRYQTATTIATKSISAGWLSSSTIGVAAKLPDALAGGAFVGYRNGVLLLTPSDYLWADTATWISGRKATVNNSYVFGGTTSITDGVRSAIDTALE